MANADEIGLAYSEESVFGTAPTGVYQILRATKESLKQDTTSVQSTELRPDRQVPDIIRTSIQASGGFEYEFHYGTYDDFIAASLMSAGWSTPVTVTDTDISQAASDNSINQAAGSFVTDGFLVGQWIEIEGFTGGGYNGLAKIVSVAALKIVVSRATMVDDAAAESITLTMGGQVVNGTTGTSFAIEKDFNDLSNIFQVLSGLMPETWQMGVNTDDLIGGSFGFLGSKQVSGVAAIGSGYTAVTTSAVMNPVDHVTAVFEGGVATDITSFSFNLNNNLRARKKVGFLGIISVGKGKINLTGSLEAYFEDNAFVAKYLAWDWTSLTLIFTDADSNKYVLELPRVKFTDNPTNATGENSDVMNAITWAAARHPTEGITIRVARFPAA